MKSVKKTLKLSPKEKWEQFIAQDIESTPEKEQYAFIVEILSSLIDNIPDQESLIPILEELAARLNKPLPQILQSLLIESLKAYKTLSSPKRTDDSSFFYPSTRDLILSAAMEVFAEKGYHETTVDDIAKRAGIGKGSIYRYFPSKEALFNALIESRIELLDNAIREIIQKDDQDVTQIIAQCVETYLAFFENNRGIYQLLFREKSASERQQYLKRAFKRLLPVRKRIFEATRKGIYKPISFEFIFYGFMGFIHGIIQRWIDHGCSYSLTEETPSILEVLFHGTVLSENRKTNVFMKEEDTDGQSSN
jgi:AcrR family transcriptional regulator